MNVKKSVFGSNSEKSVYKHLKSVWENEYNIYHNLPYANIFAINQAYYYDLNKYEHIIHHLNLTK